MLMLCSRVRPSHRRRSPQDKKKPDFKRQVEKLEDTGAQPS